MMAVNFSSTVWIGSEAQKNVGILASATLHIWIDGEHVADLCEWKVRNTRNGIAALPSSKKAGPDPKNSGKDRWFNNYRLYPGDTDNNRRNDVQNVILQEYYRKTNQSSAEPAQQPVAQPVVNMPSAAPTPAPAPPTPAPAPTATQSSPSAGSSAAPPPAGDWPYGS